MEILGVKCQKCLFLSNFPSYPSKQRKFTWAMEKMASLFYLKLAQWLHSKSTQRPICFSFDSKMSSTISFLSSCNQYMKVVIKYILQVQSHIDILIYLSFLNTIQQWKKGGPPKLLSNRDEMVHYSKGLSKQLQYC